MDITEYRQAPLFHTQTLEARKTIVIYVSSGSYPHLLSFFPSFLQVEDFNQLSPSFLHFFKLKTSTNSLLLSQPRRTNQFTCSSFSRSSHDFGIAFFLPKLEVLPYTVAKSNLGSNSWNRRTIHGWFTHSLLSILLCSPLIHSLLLFLSSPFSLHFFNWTLASKDWFKNPEPWKNITIT